MSKIAKRVLCAVISVVFLVAMSSSSVLAGSGKNNLENIPQKDGIYDLPNHPGTKVHVFVHYPKLELDAKSAPSKNVCDLTDPASASLVGAGGWHLPANIKYMLNTASAPSAALKKNMATIATNSAKTWTTAAGNKFSISQAGTSTLTVANSDDGVDLIAWGSVPNNALAVTYALFDTTGTVVGVDTILSKNVPWNWSTTVSRCDLNSYDLQNVLTHEIGHWVGLNDEYATSYSNNTMFGNASKGETKKDTLTVGDINGLKLIYP